jgi:hypothetical protein
MNGVEKAESQKKSEAIYHQLTCFTESKAAIAYEHEESSATQCRAGISSSISHLYVL